MVFFLLYDRIHTKRFEMGVLEKKFLLVSYVHNIITERGEFVGVILYRWSFSFFPKN